MKNTFLIVALCAIFLGACSKNDEIIPETPEIPITPETPETPEVPETPDFVIPENDITFIKNNIDLEDNQELIAYSVIGKDSIWGLSKEAE